MKLHSMSISEGIYSSSVPYADEILQVRLFHAIVKLFVQILVSLFACLSLYIGTYCSVWPCQKAMCHAILWFWEDRKKGGKLRKGVQRK